MSKTLKITLKRSPIGRPGKHRRIVESLGLKKLNHSVIHKDIPSIRGMVQKVSHMVEVEGAERRKNK